MFQRSTDADLPVIKEVGDIGNFVMQSLLCGYGKSRDRTGRP
jgi:hypothetical protein